jgi:hypothetical protein
MLEGPVEVQRRDTEEFDRAIADWYCMNCHHVIWKRAA